MILLCFLLILDTIDVRKVSIYYIVYTEAGGKYGSKYYRRSL